MVMPSTTHVDSRPTITPTRTAVRTQCRTPSSDSRGSGSAGPP